MKHTNRIIPISLLAFGSAVMFWPQAAFAQTDALTAPQDVTLEVLACSQIGSSSATLSWDKQPGATEYRVYTRLGEDVFGAYNSTDSAKIKLPLDSKSVSIITVTSVERTQENTKSVVKESEKSPEFEIDVPRLCEKVSPSVSLSPTATKTETPTEKPTSPTPTEATVSATVTDSPTPTEKPDQSIQQLDKKYTETRKVQAQISKQVHNVISWVKSKFFFFN